MKLISIIIVNWNGRKWLRNCLDSLYSQTYKDFEIIFVDNASEDDSVYFVRKNYPRIIIIQNEENIGFGRASNLGVKKSKGEILFFLNNDTECPKNLLKKVVDFKTKNNFDIIGPRILDEYGADPLKRQYLGIDFLGFPCMSKKLFYIEGCALMINKRDFENLGGFDEKYFMYSEDIDLCWRAFLYEMKLGICEDTTIIHFGGGSSERTRYQKGRKHIVPIMRRYEVEKNNLRNLLKNYRFINLSWCIPLFIIQDFFESLFYLFTGNLKMFKFIWTAIFWNITNLKDTLQQRKIIQYNRIIGDFKILSKMNLIPSKLKAFLIIGLPKFK